MAKRVKTKFKLQIEAGKATPAPPVGPALGQHGVNIMAFVKEYNERTKKLIGNIIPAEVTVYEDRSFAFVIKTPPTADLLRKAAGVEKGSGQPNLDKVGQITRAQLRQIAETKMPDLNARSVEAAERVVEGTARNMGIEIV